MLRTLLTPPTLFALLLFGFIAAPLQASNTTSGQDAATKKERSTLEIRTIDILPYGIKTAEKTGGIYFDLANQLAEEAGYPAHNYVAPYARIIFELKSGETDMSILFKYPELQEHVVYIAPLAPLKTVVVGLKGTDIDTLSSLQGKTIGYLRGAKFSDAIDQDTSIKKLETIDFSQAVKMLLYKRVDAIIGPMAPIISAAIELGHDQRLFGKPLTVAERTPWIQISRKSLNRISPERLSAAFDSLDKRDAVQKIHHHYLAPQTAPQQHQRTRPNTISPKQVTKTEIPLLNPQNPSR